MNKDEVQKVGKLVAKKLGNDCTNGKVLQNEDFLFEMFKIFNCGYGHGFSVYQILTEFNVLLKKKIYYKIGKRRNSDIVISIANPYKLIKETNWRPKFNNLNYILKSSLSWYRKNV